MPETITCTPEALLADSKCYCIPQPELQAGIIIFLLKTISGLTLTPKQLAEQAACYCYPDRKLQQAVITYLLCQIAQAESV